MRNRKLWIAVAAVVLLALIGAYVGSPWWATHRLLEAVKSGDAPELERRIDFEALRPSLRDQIRDAVKARAAQDPDLRDNPLAALGVLLVSGLADQVLDHVLTPEGFARLVQNAPDVDVDRPAPPREEAKGGDSTPPEVRLGYQSLDRFRIVVGDRPEAKRNVRLFLERRALFGWRLTEIELPENFLDEGMATPPPVAARNLPR